MSDIKNVAIIMDGNGRWARERKRPRVWGHVRGSSVVSLIVEKAKELNLNSLTLYAFSTENWTRPESEIFVLFSLLKKYLQKERKRIIDNNLRFDVIGNLKSLPSSTKALIESIKNETKSNTGMMLNFAFDYGGRAEIVHSINKFIEKNPGKFVDEKTIGEGLYIPALMDIDLLIRTGGEFRISNFLLWQISYAELYFTSTKWPDFTSEEFCSILEKASNRERRFGGLVDNIQKRN